jgi:hypothetical protein
MGLARRAERPSKADFDLAALVLLHLVRDEYPTTSLREIAETWGPSWIDPAIAAALDRVQHYLERLPNSWMADSSRSSR